MSVKVGIVGSRKFADKFRVYGFISVLPTILGTEDFIVVSGGAPGVDTWAEEEAQRQKFPIQIIRAEWRVNLGDGKTYLDKAAGFKRNKILVDECDKLFIFWDGKSAGTLDVIKYCRKIGKEHKIYRAEDQRQAH